LDRAATKQTGATASVLGDYMTREELAAEIGIQPKTLAKWANLRRGPSFVKVGRKVFYRKDAVQAWLRTNETRDAAVSK
jgi:hypothetical protein